MDANLGSLDRVYETLAASRRVARLENQATEMVRERTVCFCVNELACGDGGRVHKCLAVLAGVA